MDFTQRPSAKTEANGGDYEPTLTAENLGDRVEIRIRDNGTGIPLEVKERLFNPFFTTKPAGEGTGRDPPSMLDIASVVVVSTML